MNLLHLKYAVTVAETGSINRASEKLYVGQPNLSRAIRELEASLGVTIFDRSARGMELTAEGEVLVEHARNILRQVDIIEETFQGKQLRKQRFSLSVPCADYIGAAFAQFSAVFSKELDADAEIQYREGGPMNALKDVLDDTCSLGILRYPEEQDTAVKIMLEEKDICWELVAEFSQMAVMHERAPLAKQTEVSVSDLADYLEIQLADTGEAGSISTSAVRRSEGKQPQHRRRMVVYERAARMEIMENCPYAFFWSSPLPKETAQRHHLVALPCNDMPLRIRDVLIYRKNHKLSALDHAFISALCTVKRTVFL